MNETSIIIPFYISDLDHIAFRTENMEKMLYFYTNILGCRIERIRKELGLIHLRAGHKLIDLLEVRESTKQLINDEVMRRNVDHICLNVIPFNMKAIKNYLAEYGIDIYDESNRYGAMGIGKSIHIKDPDGNKVELRGG